jgi:hypothetical protein
VTYVQLYVLMDEAICCDHHRNLQHRHKKGSPSQRRVFRASFLCCLVRPQRDDGFPAAAGGRANNCIYIILSTCLLKGLLLFNQHSEKRAILHDPTAIFLAK